MSRCLSRCVSHANMGGQVHYTHAPAEASNDHGSLQLSSFYFCTKLVHESNNNNNYEKTQNLMQ